MADRLLGPCDVIDPLLGPCDAIDPLLGPCDGTDPPLGPCDVIDPLLGPCDVAELSFGPCDATGPLLGPCGGGDCPSAGNAAAAEPSVTELAEPDPLSKDFDSQLFRLPPSHEPPHSPCNTSFICPADRGSVYMLTISSAVRP